jgi:hypothetical protein
MKDIIIAMSTGLLSSLIASYAYAHLSSNFGLRQIAIFGGVAGLIALLVSKLLPRIRLLFGSGITAYYPKGQQQCINRLLNDLKKSKTVKIIGARGLDLVGERSPIGNYLEESRWQGEIEAFLINADSTHARLRVNQLAVEREKYKAECLSVDKFLGVLALRRGLQVTRYEYNADPLFRAVILDTCAYVSIYQSGVRGRLLPCFRLRSVTDPLYIALNSYCNYLRSIATCHAYKKEEGGVLLADGRQQIQYSDDTRIHS